MGRGSAPRCTHRRRARASADVTQGRRRVRCHFQNALVRVTATGARAMLQGGPGAVVPRQRASDLARGSPARDEIKRAARARGCWRDRAPKAASSASRRRPPRGPARSTASADVPLISTIGNATANAAHLADQRRAGHSRHALVGDQRIEALRLGAERRERRGARGEADRLVAQSSRVWSQLAPTAPRRPRPARAGRRHAASSRLLLLQGSSARRSAAGTR